MAANPATRSRAQDGAAAPVVPPFVGWSSLERHLATNWRPGQHVTLIGKTGSGKTHIALSLMELRSYVIFAATKRRDPLVSYMAAHGFHVVGSMREVPRTENG